MLIEQDEEVKPTGTFQLYRGFPNLYGSQADTEAHERYIESLTLMGENNPGYLGELHFTGVAYFEWKYEGNLLTESEVWQIVDCIQDCAAGKYRPMDNGIILAKEESAQRPPLQFKYGKNRVTYEIDIREMEGHFIIHINGELSAQIELLEEDWEVTGGDIYDPDLLAEILRRIKANT